MSPKVDIKEQIRIFVKHERKRYEAFAVVLEWLLGEVKHRVAPKGMACVRAKEVASFAEKILRKPKYDDPVHQFSDLCGGRLIVHTRDEMATADKLIGQCLKIIEREDKIDIAEVNQFGYSSVHLDVAIPSDFEKKLEKVGFPLTGEVAKALALVREPRHDNKQIERKAEIQIRTDLQHVWADTLHDLLYKGGITMPKALQREANRLSAVLEEASSTVDELVKKLGAYKVDHGAFLGEKQRDEEQKRLSMLLEQDLSDKALCSIALRLAKMARSMRDWDGVIGQEKWIGKALGPVRDELRFMVAEAQCRRNQDTPNCEEFISGMKELELLAMPVSISVEGKNEEQKLCEISRAIESQYSASAGKTVRPMAMAELARSVFVRKSGQKYARDARNLYFQAHLLDPGNPYVFARYLHSQTIAQENRSSAIFMRVAIEHAIDTCHDHALVGIELPFAHFSEGLFHALVGDIGSCLLCCTRGIASSNDPRQIKEEIILFKELKESLEDSDAIYSQKISMVIRTLYLGLAIKDALKDKKKSIKLELDLRSIDKGVDQPIVIFVGTCDPTLNGQLEQYRPMIDHAFEGFTGTVYSGGTDAGIAGIVGDAVEKARKAGMKISLKAHRPGMLKENDYSKRHDAYSQITMDNAVGFTYEQPIQYWIDLLAHDVWPANVRVLGVGGGPIAMFEYHLAVALGAMVGIVDGSGRSGGEIVSGESWWAKAKIGRCFTLPNDKETIWNFVNVVPGDWAVTDKVVAEVGPVARGLHEKYVAGMLSGNCARWEKLDNQYQMSNYYQAIHAKKLLSKYNLEILPLDPSLGKPVQDMLAEVGKKIIEELAEMEHGRWNVEKLMSGWKYGPVRDNNQFIHPLIRSWDKLPDVIDGDEKNGEKWKDREPFINLPDILKNAGLGIYRKESALNAG
jgi:ppGpp synthetase/RelA/SpoT-type nucleotidyltranferase